MSKIHGSSIIVERMLNVRVAAAHVRRMFFDVHAANGSEIAREALDRIGGLYGTEATINGLSADERPRQRQERLPTVSLRNVDWWSAYTCGHGLSRR